MPSAVARPTRWRGGAQLFDPAPRGRSIALSGLLRGAEGLANSLAFVRSKDSLENCVELWNELSSRVSVIRRTQANGLLSGGYGITKALGSSRFTIAEDGLRVIILQRPSFEYAHALGSQRLEKCTLLI